MRPRIVACDLDGTLLRSDGSVCDRTRDALQVARATGALIVLCTARPPRWIRPIAEAIGDPTVVICANGAVLWDALTESVLTSYPLEPALAREVAERINARVPGGAWAVERESGFAHERGYVPRWPVGDDATVDTLDALLAKPVLKLMVRHSVLSADVLLDRARRAVGHLVELSHSSTLDTLLEISAPGVTKASALTRFCAERGYEPEDVIAFGDMPNDLSMLRWAGYAVAVANAHPDVLAAADEITAANDDAGVALVLERIFGG
jgi:Cof subfamily protein (haloacid dehalogenase superfamily)